MNDATTKLPTWNASLVVGEEKSVPLHNDDGTPKLSKKTGLPLVLKVVKRSIELTRGHLTMVFPVSRGANGNPIITDARAAATGSARLTNRGPLPGEAYIKPGKVEKLSPSGWAREVGHLIGEEAVTRIFLGLINEGFAAAS